jgi:hypothetical protein
MVVQVVRDGILFGADRNVTTDLCVGDDVLASGQTQHPKVLKWPNHEIVVGCVGRATITDDVYTDEWLYDFIGHNLHHDLPQLTHDNLKQLAYELQRRLEFDLARYGSVDDDAMVLHLGAFVEDHAGQWTPEVWYIRNAEAPYRHVNLNFDVSEEIPKYFPGLTGDQIQVEVERRAQAWQPFWFHQGYDLQSFNALDEMIRRGMRAIVETHPDRPHPFPDSTPFFEDSLREWSKHLKMAILTYGAYFGAFYEPFQQFVGGGADVVWAARPQVPPMA